MPYHQLDVKDAQKCKNLCFHMTSLQNEGEMKHVT